MCGLAGQINLDGTPIILQNLIAMTEALNHRGPDDTGIGVFSLKQKEYFEIPKRLTHYHDYKMESGIGYKRLSIQDLSINGHQPMTDSRNKIILAFNGEIYNAPEYRQILKANGYSFKSTSDTEVILNLYQYYGFEKMLSVLNGMFAICIIDLNIGEIFIARDRVGIKPLVYFCNAKTILFASEVKSFLFNSCFEPELNDSVIDEYFIFRYVSGRQTLLKNVYNLLPGEYLKIDTTGIHHIKYWELPNYPDRQNLSFSDVYSEFDFLLKQSIKYRLLSDVNIGCQLSGGIDSSIITKMAVGEIQQENVHSLSVILQDQTISEERYIDIASRVINTITHKYLLDDAYFIKNIKKTIWHFDFPLTHPNSIGIFMIAERAREYFTVFLSGEGADELFGGYPRFVFGNIMFRNKKKMEIIRRTPYVSKYFTSKFSNGFSSPSNYNAIIWYVLSSAQINKSNFNLFDINLNVEPVLEKRISLFNEGTGDFISKCQRYELKTYLVDLLARQDKMLMAHSVEGRVPFLDHNIVEFARKIPTKYLVDSNIAGLRKPDKFNKILLKEYGKKYYNNSFIYRVKNGFVLPLSQFLRNKIFFEEFYQNILPGIKSRGIMKAENIESLFKTHFNDTNSEFGYLLWNIINFEIWAQLFLDKKFRN